MFENPFQKSVQEKKEFLYTLELVPGRGARGKTQEEILRTAQKIAASRLVHALSITDNPGGHPALAPDVIGQEICRMGVEPIIHFTCKDKNRNQIESILYALDRIGLHNLLVMTGDYPLYGFEGKAKPVYDIDSVQLLGMIRQMNEGRCIDLRAPGGGLECPPTHFFKGVAVSPFKREEPEVMAQYYKLYKKVQSGADFVITQVGFDARKFDELLRFLRHQDLRIPVIGNVYLPTRPVARVMNQGGVPGCVINDDLYRMIETESQGADRGKSARLTRAAKLIAVLRGIGYAGVHLGGPHLVYEDVERVIEKSKEFYPHWEAWVRELSFPQPGGFYLYEKDSRTGLNQDAPAPLGRPSRKRMGFALMRFFHNFVFLPQAPLHKPARWLCRKIDGSRAEWFFTEVENWIKFFTSRCRRCGDCTLAEMAFLCPQSQCPKFLFNGQCGGSYEGWCEVFPGKRRCIYVRAYDRLKAYGEEGSLKEGYLPPRNWVLDQTSSWTNYFLGRDHHQLRS
jgi:methylenetetrahydrofolate reductase (NADPH)